MSVTKQQGVSLYLTIVILSVLTAALLALVALSISQTRIIWTIGDSVIAFYAADTGIERALYNIYQAGYMPDITDGCPFSDNLGAASYEVCVSPGDAAVIWSTGTHNTTQTKRKIEIKLIF